MSVGTITDPNTGETFANVDDLLNLFRDIKEHPEKYNKEAVVTLIGQLAGKIAIRQEIEKPF